MNSFRFNNSDYLLTAMYFLIATAWLAFRYTVEEYTNFEIITGLLGFILKTLVLIVVLTWLIQRFIVSQKNYFLFFLLAFTTLGLVGYLDLLRDYFTADPSWEWNPSLDIILVNSFYNSTPDVALPLGIILGKKYYENKLDYVKLQNAQKELELKVLRSQYDPHFLYNSLNTIDALIDYSPKEIVKQYLSHLAGLYRHLIQTKDFDIVTLEDELELARNYFYLIETRFENDYHFEIIDMGIPKVNYLPNGAILAVLENVVKHNKALDGNSIRTAIIIEEETILVTNTKAKRLTKNNTLGTGLDNLSKRYELLSDKKIEIQETDGIFNIKLPLLKVLD
ncbi:sensor histidine kinase [Maribacter aestuarii]|uniref:sensor histidine kinase n=1 Tax=Maribacter aestuarii TaxID=1130723 RepID=UPI00248AA752|nr:sensor histidine kinase [Maribacter aestuarii]